MVLEDRHGRHRLFPLNPAGFLVDGSPSRWSNPRRSRSGRASRASGSVKVEGLRAQTARPAASGSRACTTPSSSNASGATTCGSRASSSNRSTASTSCPQRIAEFGTAPAPAPRRAGRPPRRELQGTRIVAAGRRRERAGHRPPVRRHLAGREALGPSASTAWPVIPRGVDWKDGVCTRWAGARPTRAGSACWARVSSYRDIESGPARRGRTADRLRHRPPGLTRRSRRRLPGPPVRCSPNAHASDTAD